MLQHPESGSHFVLLMKEGGFRFEKLWPHVLENRFFRMM
jgi:hypothetical protein